ncbi:sigma 54-interacting transcriptional regulator [Burkholderia stabilis]|uniref:sigma 54-interacting transcriptional regulator n=1 Tax=Burkholderia stabilis TaxID=95485 RepID=UPI001589D340|nr:sigma 54-interacting transcriptional regulator [Burkholderia stabilis]
MTGTQIVTDEPSRHDPVLMPAAFVLPARSVAEAELFGYADGAFTGARTGGNPGKIELADRGTLFLDEIGDMPLSLQTRLLRVIQERTVTRVGSTREIGVDILVMCATHQDLSALVRRGVFREDLYFRLGGIAVRLPALRDRKDLPDLVNTALRDFARGRDKHFDHDVMDFFLSYPWPGNLRELHQVIRTSVAISGDCERIGLEHFDAVWLEAVDRSRHGGFSVPAGARPKRTHRTSNEAIQSALNQLNGNRSEAARELGISRATIHRRILRGEVQ